MGIVIPNDAAAKILTSEPTDKILGLPASEGSPATPAFMAGIVLKNYCATACTFVGGVG